jgi:hypothetical protein
MTEQSFQTALRREITRIRKGLGCPVGEAFFTLQSSIYPPPEALFEGQPESGGGPPRHSRRRALHFTRDLLCKLEEYRSVTQAGDFSLFLRAVEVCGATGSPLSDHSG